MPNGLRNRAAPYVFMHHSKQIKICWLTLRRLNFASVLSQSPSPVAGSFTSSALIALIFLARKRYHYDICFSESQIQRAYKFRGAICPPPSVSFSFICAYFQRRHAYFSCIPDGLCGQAGPVLVEPHQMHLLAPCPWRCLPVGENGHADPYDDEPHHSQCFSSSMCSCFFVGLWVQA